MRFLYPRSCVPRNSSAECITAYAGLVTAVLFGSLLRPAQLTSTPPPDIRRHLQDVARGLPADSILRKEIEFGVHGTGVRYPWMDLAKNDGVMRIEVEVNFTWHRGLQDLQPVRVMFFSSYDDLAEQITDNAALENFKIDGLRSKVEQAALNRARQGVWFESPEHQIPRKRGRVPASTVVLLYDDPWLPLPQVWYGTRDMRWTPLDDAAFMGDQVAVRKLLAEKKVKQRDLDSALSWAATEDSVSVIHLLLDGGADTNVQMKSGGTALTIAVANGHPRSVGILLKAGADPNSRDAEGDSALDIAVQHHYEQVAAILRKFGAARSKKNE